MPKITKHPGVYIRPVKKDGKVLFWRIAYTDPDSCKTRNIVMSDADAQNARTRENAAVELYRRIVQRELELKGGAAKLTGTAVKDGFEQYFADHPKLRERTRAGYRKAAAALADFLRKRKITTLDEITRPVLISFRASLVGAKKQTPEVGGKSGARVETDELRSPHTINRELRHVRVVLGYLRELNMLPRCSLEDLKIALKREKTGRGEVRFFRTPELRQLLDACLRHDETCYRETRAEHAGIGEAGTTERYDPIAAFTVVTLLSGVRFEEVLTLQWPQILFEQNDIHILRTKTHDERMVDMGITPALRRLLAALKLRTGGHGRVFPDLTIDKVKSTLYKRLKPVFGAPPKTNWQMLRRTASSYVCCAPGLYGDAHRRTNSFHEALRHGHSQKVSEERYSRAIKDLPMSARTLEDAMGIADLVDRIIDRVSPSNVVSLTG